MKWLSPKMPTPLSWVLWFVFTVAGGVTPEATFAAASQSTSPLPPDQECASFHFADEQLTTELVAAEPEVVSPVAIAWDADGRLFVAEMSDYPNATNGGRIKLLEDRDGDGRYERGTVFAENLPFPNGVLPWNGGVLVTAAPDILFLKDTDGDGRADERRVLLTGFGQGNQQLRVNGLFWGLDNWVYGANGRSDGEIRRPNDPSDKTISLRGHDFRFRPNTGEFEAIVGRSQFGSSRDDWGNRFLSWNTIPIRHEVLPERYLNRNPNLTTTESLLDVISPGDDGRVFPLTPPPLVFNNESSSHYNALAGLTIYRGDALGEKYRGDAFVGESLRNLVHRRVLVPKGVTFTARRGEEGREFLASTDPWFHPVNFATGPDGALYVVDFYRRFVEHPGFVPGNLRDQIQWRTGAEHGRIWRILPKGSNARVRRPRPQLSHAGNAELVAQLDHPNAWWRDTAQRLIVERRDTTLVPRLKSILGNRRSTGPLARLSSFWTLEGLDALDDATLQLALRDHDAGIREQAIRLAEMRLKVSPESIQRILPLKDDPNIRVRFQLALSLGESGAEAMLEGLTQLLRRDFTNHWVSSAILTSIGAKPEVFLEKLVRRDRRWLGEPSPPQAEILDQIGRLVGAQHTDAERAAFLMLLNDSGTASSTSGHLALLAGFADGLARSSRSLPELMSDPPAKDKTASESLAQFVALAGRVAATAPETKPHRLFAIRVLARSSPESGGKLLLELLQTNGPAEIQCAAVEALLGFGSRDITGKMFEGWKQYTPVIKRYLSANAPRSATALAALVEALEGGIITPEELDPSTRQTLRNVQNPDLANRLKKVVQPEATPTRDEVVRNFQPCLKMKGDCRRGAVTFARLCLPCHAIQGRGNHVGPDLSDVASRPKEALLVDILDPSRQVTPDFISYSLTTMQGETVTGLIAAENPNSVTLRRAGQPDETILRNQITGLKADGKSLMPEGLEQGLTQQDLADLLDFLTRPDPQLLPQEK